MFGPLYNKPKKVEIKLQLYAIIVNMSYNNFTNKIFIVKSLCWTKDGVCHYFLLKIIAV